MHGVEARKRRRVADDLAAQQHLEAALGAVADGAIMADRHQRITFMNAAAESMLGVRLRFATGSRLSDVLPIIDTETGAPIDEAVRAAGATRRSEPQWRRAVLERAPRQTLILQYAVTALRDAHGVLSGSVSVLRDISDRGVLEHESTSDDGLADSGAALDEKERAQVTLDSIANGVISADFRGQITFLNHIAENITGWTNAEARGRALPEVLSLLDSTTREPVAGPGMRAIIEGRIVTVDAPRTLIRRDGREVEIEHSASPIRDKNGSVIGTVLVVHDVTHARSQAQRLAQLALYDSLTQLPNRTLLMDRLDRALERARRGGIRVGLLFIDLDRFKPVNDSLGHAVGDQLLLLVAQRLLNCMRKADTVSRLGGDEFVIMLEDLGQLREAARCAAKIRETIEAPFVVAGHRVRLGASIGIAVFPDDAADSAELLRCADLAMYGAKSKARRAKADVPKRKTPASNPKRALIS
jgi:diguanylate cyclase (GGDEF)-like protein/PAS domain S-box-containing protein